ncbi:hypothetical protein AMTR_s00024p00196930 [Amborella trichopoda]|uniref:Uncharacterized protein n=1 Tax=Amborella trichopoda TaxID=13333 RepID=W1PME7_AMBTC|nr:hypothetical protein AMTR_s00024p00196930 [Amborella trichopoda]
MGSELQWWKGAGERCNGLGKKLEVEREHDRPEWISMGGVDHETSATILQFSDMFIPGFFWNETKLVLGAFED